MSKIKIRVIDAYVYKKSSDKIKYLILKRAKTKMYEHLWQGVAGKIEKNETAWQAAIRELNLRIPPTNQSHTWQRLRYLAHRHLHC